MYNDEPQGEEDLDDLEDVGEAIDALSTIRPPTIPRPINWHLQPRFVHLHAALTSKYGKWRADQIADGLDEPTNTDLESWRNIGRQY